MLSTHEVIIYTKFHENWAKIVDFLLKANCLASPLFYYLYFTESDKYLVGMCLVPMMKDTRTTWLNLLSNVGVNKLKRHES